MKENDMNKQVYDLIFDKKLMFVLPEDICRNEKVSLKRVVIVVFLYYANTLKRYLQYIDNIPEEITVYILSSNKNIFNEIEAYVSEKENRFFVQKENRGRDVSALLVAAREVFKKSEFFCFVHDKKEHVSSGEHAGLRENTQIWVRNLWDNTLKNGNYIRNILNLFDENKQIGLLVPPEPIGECRDEWYSNSWKNNFNNTKALAKMLGVCADISLDKSPITLGTVFWCRTNALKKLFVKNWDYTDFPEEPLPGDGTISHAVERILSYVSLDAGYDTGFVMCNSYAQELLLYSKQMLTLSQELVKDAYGISKMYQIKNLQKQKIEVKVFFDQYDEVFLYGAGYIGRDFLRVLRSWGYMPKGFLVSNGNVTQRIIDELPVYELSELTDRDKKGVIITIRKDMEKEFANNLLKYGYRNYITCLFTF